MAKELFIPRNFSASTLGVIEAANKIIREYQRQGFKLTLRQLYYQFVARDLIKNKLSEYKRLGSIINDARLAGLIDWAAIEDRTRELISPSTWDDPEQILDAVGSQYKEDLWRNQPKRVEVWIEKNALIGVIEPVCTRWRVPYFACIGNVSQSCQYDAGKRIIRDATNFQRRTLILHLGDHDPNGIDMTRDNQDRLSMFSNPGGIGSLTDVKRIALNMDQVERYNPPPNPAKETDSRFASYIAAYGTDSWELDALEPQVIDQLIETEILQVINMDTWNRDKQEEEDNKALLKNCSERWEDVKQFLETEE